MTLSNEEKRQIMNELAQGKPGLFAQDAPYRQEDQNLKTENYENFDDFARRSGDESLEGISNSFQAGGIDSKMLEHLKMQITQEINQVKEVGQVRSERVREIVRSAVAQVAKEIKSGSSDVRSIVKSAISAVSESLQDKGSEVKEEVTASIEGVIEGVSSWRRQSITKTKAEVKHLQNKIETEEEQLQQEIERLLKDVEEAGKDTSPKFKAAIESAISGLKNSEEVALMQKRYAQLQGQIAILRANLVARYGGRYEEVKEYVEEAKNWYKQTSTPIDQAQQKRSHLEERLSEAGEAITKKQRQLRNILSELLQTTAELLREKEPPTHGK